CSGDCKAPTNGCKNDSRRGSTPWSKLGRTSASFSSSSSRIRKRRSIDPSPFSGFLPLKKLIQQILTAAQVRDTVELGYPPLNPGRLMFPAPVQPEVLCGCLMNAALQGGREALGDGPHGIRAALVFLGQ